jgi:hypothetical protein
MSEDNSLINIIKDIESGNFSSNEIVSKYNLTKYKYYTILKESDIKNPYISKKITKFKKMLQQSPDNGNSSFDLEKFKEDCKNGVKISELMEKYGLSLYEIRELRKKYDLKTR